MCVRPTSRLSRCATVLRISFLAAGAFLVASAAAAQPPSARASRTPTLVHVGPPAPLAIVTPDAVTLSVVARLTNRTRDTLWIYPHDQHAPYPVQAELEWWDGRRWRFAWGSGTDLGGMGNAAPRSSVAPGAARVDTVRVWGARGARAAHAAPTFTGHIPGTYRLRYRAVYRRWDLAGGYRDSVPDAPLTSNAFRIVMP
jgi:hypothetical protein